MNILNITPIVKKANINQDVYSYLVIKNENFNYFRVNEYLNGEFISDYGEYEDINEAIKTMNVFLMTGDTKVLPFETKSQNRLENEFMISFTHNNRRYRYDKILKSIQEID